MNLEVFLAEIASLSRAGPSFKPHKHLAILAVAQLVEQGHIASGKVFFDAEFRAAFLEQLKKHGTETDRNRPHTPFFHLRSHRFWRLVPVAGKESTLESVSSVGSAGDLTRIVSYAELDDEVFKLLSDGVTRQQICEAIALRLDAGRRRLDNGEDRENGTQSLFAHEQSAMDSILARAKSHQLGEVLNNLEIHDAQSNRYYEIDTILISCFGVFVTELKHWSGRIEIQPNNWLQNNSFYKTDPHRANNFKAKLLKGLYERRFPSYPNVFFDSVVVLTHPDVDAVGQSAPTTEKQNPTFDSIDAFFRFLKHRNLPQKRLLSRQQCIEFAKYLKSLHTESTPKDFVFNGYEIVERLYQYTDRAEVIARRTDIRHRKLCRLRVFYPPVNPTEAAKREAHERATNTLNAVAKIGEHPHVLRVWDIPNDYSYVVEGSDWSETGTLRDLLSRETRLAWSRAEPIVTGLLRGLQVAHNEYVIHRSVSPENVLMLDDTPKLMNFDLSFQLEDERVTVIPDSTQLPRSPYIAAEIYAGGVMPEAMTDLFSVGVVLYEMVVGEPPFKCSTDLDQSSGKLATERRQKLVEAELPDSIVTLVCDLIQRDPQKRPPSADKVLELLQESPEPPFEELQPNRQLQPSERCQVFEIVEFQRFGAESQIYLSKGIEGRKILLKLFSRDVPRARIFNEHRCSGAVQHPSIVRVNNYGQSDDGRYYIAFDWIEGKSLRELIDAGERPKPELFCTVAEQLLTALELLHQHTHADDATADPVLHNDLKPDNILLTAANRPVVVDFGAARGPGIGIYEGTEGYVAPDLRLGEERSYCADGDLYGVAVTLFEWATGVRPSCEAIQHTGFPAAIDDWLAKGFSPNADDRYRNADEMKQALVQVWRGDLIPSDASSTTAEEDITDRGDYDKPETEDSDELAIGSDAGVDEATGSAQSNVDPNPFVPYLNSMHNCSAQTENALAENQSMNPYFSYIHVSHPLVDEIEGTLRGDERRHVIVTGHAGDGKSTIALELFKRLTRRAADQPLDSPLNKREDFEIDGVSVALIKDFSELSEERGERNGVINEMLDPTGPRFFLISNTGILLETFKAYEKQRDDDWVSVESSLLERMEQSVPKRMVFRETELEIVNIAMLDNLGLAEAIFRRMLAPERWTDCESSSCRHHCPIFRNVQLIRQNQETVITRLFYAYRRIHEYGSRLTVRQLTAHLAYLITSGLTYKQIMQMAEKPSPPRISKFLFFNRFFGDDGQDEDEQAQQLHAIGVIREQEFGSRPNALWERKLWLQTRDQSFALKATTAPDDFPLLLRAGTGIKQDGLAADAAREQVRRAVYFLDELVGEEGERFIASFLKSVMLIAFVRWQEQGDTSLSLKERVLLQRRILHVLQEHFTGVRMPEGVDSDHHLYVTLSRRSREIRQSAQVVLARFHEDDFVVELQQREGVGKKYRRELVLRSKRNEDIELELRLPFLDYVMLRNQGEMGQELQASYVDRMERFKGQLIRVSADNNGEEIMLVRLRTNHTFRRQIFAVRADRLEVTDG